jgi:sucrose phosphorylase
LIKVRRRQPAFHPNAPFKIIEVGSKAFAIARYCKDQVIYAIANISSKPVTVSLSEDGAPNRMNDLLTGSYLNKSSIRLKPYQYVWLSTK